MRLIFLYIAFALSTSISFAQQIDVDDLLEFSSYSSRKLETVISKKGFIPIGTINQNDTIIDTWEQAIRKPDTTIAAVSRRISKYQNGKETYYSFQTSSPVEFKTALERLKQEGFKFAADPTTTDSNLLFQKKNITIQTSRLTEDTVSYYSLFFQQKALPGAKSVRYGNDLLQFTSHEFLTTFFGQENVRKDVYYFSEKEVNKCSILFPNTPRQAVFIWEDELNLTGLSHIIIGGAVRTESGSAFNQQIRENTWQLENGVRLNMRLDQLLELNEGELFFYGEQSEFFLTLAPKNKGTIDLATTCIVLDCINCEGSPALNKNMVAASEAVDKDLRLHVGLIILMPPSTNITTRSKYASR